MINSFSRRVVESGAYVSLRLTETMFCSRPAVAATWPNSLPVCALP